MSSQPDLDEVDREYVARELATFRQRVTAVENVNEELQERVDHLEFVIERLVTDLPTQKKSKREKMAAIVRRVAEEAPTGAVRYTISRDLAAGAAGCGKRHALNLFEDLEAAFPWATYVPDAQPMGQLRVEFGERGPDAFLEAVLAEFPEVGET